jgi:blocked early in transport 1
MGFNNNDLCFLRGHYSDAVLSSLESQNDSEIEGISARVKMLKDVSLISAFSLIFVSYLSSLSFFG